MLALLEMILVDLVAAFTATSFRRTVLDQTLNTLMEELQLA